MPLDRDELCTLLKRWEQIIWDGSERARQNAIRSRGGLEARMKISRAKPDTLCYEWNRQQQGVQTALTQMLPQLKSLIWAEPDLRGDWPARNYIDLYVNHYETIIFKLRRAFLDPETAAA